MVETPSGRASADQPWVTLPALVEWDESTSEAHWAAVSQLIAASDELVLTAQASSWCFSDRGPVQALGAEILGELALESDDAREQLLTAATKLVVSADEDVRWSLAISLRYAASDWRSTAFLLRLLGDVDDHVRFQTATVIGFSDEDDPRSSEVTEALLRTQGDPSPQVRDWATFALGVLRDEDTPAIRDGLLGALDDVDEGVAAEAARSLAKRRDPRVRPRLVRELLHAQVDDRYVEAAASLGDPALRPLLADLDSGGWADTEQRRDTLADALDACNPEPS